MSYVKTSWIARVGTALNRFLKANESSSSVELTADPTGVSTAGTPFTADNMNKIEDGIHDAHYPTFTEASTLENVASGEVQETLWGKVMKAISYVIGTAKPHIENTSNPHGVSKEQITGLKNTDSPEFSSVELTSANFIAGGKLVHGFYTYGGAAGELDSTIFSMLSPVIPNTDDRCMLNGFATINATSDVMFFSMAERTSSTIIRIVGGTVGGTIKFIEVPNTATRAFSNNSLFVV